MAERNGKAGGMPVGVPRHVAIIMDGNGRWAKKRGMPRTYGHKVGAETFRRIATYCKNLGMEYITVYAFSTENWKRPPEEVNTIMDLLEKYLNECIDSMERDQIRLKVIGDTCELSPQLRALIKKTDAIAQTMPNAFQANICLNYGGRDEIVRAAKKWAESGAVATEDAFSSFMDTAEIPDPDLLIRPGGELRLSNFLLWQCAYSELYFTDTLWPDFTEREIDIAVETYMNRNRRYGGI